MIFQRFVSQGAKDREDDEGDEDEPSTSKNKGS